MYLATCKLRLRSKEVRRKMGRNISCAVFDEMVYMFNDWLFMYDCMITACMYVSICPADMCIPRTLSSTRENLRAIFLVSFRQLFLPTSKTYFWFLCLSAHWFSAMEFTANSFLLFSQFRRHLKTHALQSSALLRWIHKFARNEYIWLANIITKRNQFNKKHTVLRL